MSNILADAPAATGTTLIPWTRPDWATTTSYEVEWVTHESGTLIVPDPSGDGLTTATVTRIDSVELTNAGIQITAGTPMAWVAGASGPTEADDSLVELARGAHA